MNKSFRCLTVSMIVAIVVSTIPLLFNSQQALASLIYGNRKQCVNDLPSHVRSQSGVQVSENVDISGLCNVLVGHSGTITDVTHGVSACIRALSDIKDVNRICNELNPPE